MAELTAGTFGTYALTDIEQIQGRHLTPLNVMSLQNDLATYANAKLQILFDPTNVQEYVQQEAYLRAKIDYIKELLSYHEDAIHQLDNARKEAVQYYDNQAPVLSNIFTINNQQ